MRDVGYGIDRMLILELTPEMEYGFIRNMKRSR